MDIRTADAQSSTESWTNVFMDEHKTMTFMDERIHGRADSWTNGFTGERIYGFMDERMFAAADSERAG